MLGLAHDLLCVDVHLYTWDWGMWSDLLFMIFLISKPDGLHSKVSAIFFLLVSCAVLISVLISSIWDSDDYYLFVLSWSHVEIIIHFHFGCKHGNTKWRRIWQHSAMKCLWRYEESITRIVLFKWDERNTMEMHMGNFYFVASLNDVLLF